MRRIPVVEIYKATDGWRWRLKAVNGRILADSGEAYTRKNGCQKAIANFPLYWTVVEVKND